MLWTQTKEEEEEEETVAYRTISNEVVAQFV
jgi:hypothetical protein